MDDFSLDDLDKVLADLQSTETSQPSSNETSHQATFAGNADDLDSLLDELESMPQRNDKKVEISKVKSEPVRPQEKKPTTILDTTFSELNDMLGDLQSKDIEPKSNVTSQSVQSTQRNQSSYSELDDLLADLPPQRDYVPERKSEKQTVDTPVFTKTVKRSEHEKPANVPTTQDFSELDELLESLPSGRSYTPPQNTTSQISSTSVVNAKPTRTQTSQQTTDTNDELDDLLADLPGKREFTSPTRPPTITQTTQTTSRSSANDGLDDLLADLPGKREYTSSTQPSSSIQTSSSQTSKYPEASSVTSLSEDKVCAGCRQVISGMYIVALDRYWCNGHFNCISCGDSLTGNFFDLPSGVTCSSCAAKDYSCHICSKPITGVYLSFENGRKAHKECVPQETCARCNRLIEGGSPHVEAAGKIWHNDCFTCTKCRTGLGSTFVNYEASPYCSPCFKLVTQGKNIVLES